MKTTASEEHLITRLKWWKQRWSDEHDQCIRQEEQIKRLEGERDHWHREADKWHAEAERIHLEGDELQAQVFGALQRIYGGDD